MSIFSRDTLKTAFPNNPRAVAEFERLDALLSNVDENGQTLADKLAGLQATVDNHTFQDKHPLLDAISELPNRVGSIEVTQNGQAKIRPIDAEDPASLVSRGAGYTVYVGFGGLGPTANRPVLPLGYVAIYFDTDVDPDGQPIIRRADGVWLDMHGDPV